MNYIHKTYYTYLILKAHKNLLSTFFKELSLLNKLDKLVNEELSKFDKSIDSNELE